MKFETLWEGTFPAYWDLTPWTTLDQHFLVCCFRKNTTRERVIRVWNLQEGTSYEESAVFNALLGSNEGNIYFARVTDARSHLQVNRVSSYVCDIMNLSVQYTIPDSFLVEKYKIPFLTTANLQEYALGKNTINLKTGEVKKCLNRAERGWAIGNGMRLEQIGQNLVCLKDDKTLWEKETFYGNWFHGSHGDLLYFLLSNDEIVIFDRDTGELRGNVTLENLNRVSNRLGGSFDYFNDASFGCGTIFDALINNQMIAWTTIDNRLVIKNMQTGQQFLSEPYEFEICLSKINDNYVQLFTVKDAANGKIVIVRVGEMVNGTDDN